MTQKPTILVFSYGTFKDRAVQLEVFGTILPVVGNATLKNWKVFTDKEYPYVKPLKGDEVKGLILKMNKSQLKIADQWEAVPTTYQREKLDIVLEDGSVKQVYVFTGRNIV
ncbi:MAG: gamma-glutamylcyclotransferase [Bacteroidetes bacterium]|nr:gamma-glutamylcyclotransferase [Bacteroidota bacterium]